MANLASPFTSRFPTFPKNTLKYQTLFHILQVTFHSDEVLSFLNKIHVPRGKMKSLSFTGDISYSSTGALCSLLIIVATVHKVSYFQEIE